MAKPKFKKGDKIHSVTVHSGQVWWREETVEELTSCHAYRMKGDNYDTDGEYYDRVKTLTKTDALILLSEDTAKKIVQCKDELKAAKSEHKLVLDAIKKEQGK